MSERLSTAEFYYTRTIFVSLSLSAIKEAREHIAGRLHVTPVMTATRLGERVGVNLVLKCENLQKTGSFKVRGVLNKLRSLDQASKDRGVVTVSAGNHAAALAWGSRENGVKATVVMPTVASPAKVEASRGYGAEVVLHGQTGFEAFAKAHELADERGLTFVHPFDDEFVCAGQGTVGLEIIDQVKDADVVVVPIGGGGLIGGVAPAIKLSNPRIRVYGVEPAGAPSMRRSLDEGKAVRLDSLSTIADGLAAPFAGEINYQMVRRYCDDVVLIDDDVIAMGVRELLLSTKLLAETAGAAATGAILSGAIPVKPGERVVSIVSGGNIDLAKLSATLDRSARGTPTR
jgi:threonine dehydratase